MISMRYFPLTIMDVFSEKTKDITILLTNLKHIWIIMLPVNSVKHSGN